MPRFSWRTADPKSLIGATIPIPPRDFGNGVVTAVAFGPLGLMVYEAAAQAQIPWPDGLIIPDPRWEYPCPHIGHPLTLERLADAYKRLDAWARQRAEAVKAAYQPGRIVTGGFFRPLGTTWGEDQYEDPRGVIDATDALGHWYMAIDISRTATGRTWSPVIPQNIVNAYLSQAGLGTPFAGEPWHFRPIRVERERWAQKKAVGGHA